jgi:predicted AlkP superfamily phosphohydrolase/phosphomutase
MGSAAPVMMIGLDAAELTLVERLCDDGKLPTLAGLKRHGCFASLEAEATIFAGAVWPTFYTGTRVPWHGIYQDQLWRFEKMRFETARDHWLSPTPFWEMLDRDCRAAIVDVPMVLRAPRSMNGVMISGWGTHDRVFAGTQPRALAAELRRECGPPIMSWPLVRPRTAAEFLALRDDMIATTEQMARLCRRLLVRGPWDLFCVVLGAPHRGGHHLWDLSQIEPLAPGSARTELERGLEDVYVACDRAVAQVLEATPSNARILIFAVHGMGPNPGWNDRFDEMLAAAGAPPPGRVQEDRRGLARTFLNKVMETVFAQLPQRARVDRVNRRRTRRHDWSATRYFPLVLDHAGYLRINLAGREPRGIVQPGADYRGLCDELSDALSNVRDMASDEPIVERVYRLDDLAPSGASHRDALPDLVITWGGPSAIRSPGLYRPGHGAIRWDGNGVLPSLRCGNHTSQGWCIAVGPGIDEGTRVSGHHIADLAPTVLEWLGTTRQPDLHGQPIAALCGG